MSMCLRVRLAGMALILGGLTAGVCHLFNFDSPTEMNQIAEYPRFAEPVHLVLFMAGMLALLGWFGRYALEDSGSRITGGVAFVCLFPGILCGDLLHCILEFSVFPVLGSTVPYALPGIAEATYRSVAMAGLLMAGHYLMFVGAAATAVSTYRSHIVPPWVAASFALSAVLLGLRLFPTLAAAIGQASSMALYLSMAALGLALLWSAGGNGRQWAQSTEKRAAICREGWPPDAQ
jgi:predicted permease